MDFLKQAESHLKKGKQELTTGVFKWSKDYLSAVVNFDEAVKNFKLAKAWDKAILALEQCRLCNEKLNEIWGAARNIEAMVTILTENIDTKEVDRLIQLTNEASNYFKAVDSFTESIKLKTKTAKFIVKYGKTNEAIQLLESAMQDADESEKQYNKKEVFDYYIELLVDIGEYQKAISGIKAQFGNPADKKSRFNTPSNGLSIVILSLLADEVIRAEEEFNSLGEVIPDFFSSREYEICETLIGSYREGDQDLFTQQSSKANVTSLFPSIIPRLLKKKKLRNAHKKVEKNDSNGQQLSQKNSKTQNSGEQVYSQNEGTTQFHEDDDAGVL